MKHRRKDSVSGSLSKRARWGIPILRIDPEPNTAFEQLLANPSATALNQNDEHYNEQNAGNNSDNRDIFHVDSPFFLIKSIS